MLHWLSHNYIDHEFIHMTMWPAHDMRIVILQGNGEQVIMAKIYYPDGDNSGPTKIVDGHDKHVDNHDDHHDGDHDNDHHGDHQDDHHNDHDDDHDDHHNDHADDHDDHSDSHVNCDHDKGKDKLMMVLMPTEK